MTIKSIMARIKAHKIWSAIIAIILVFIGYRVYSAMAAGDAVPTYTLSAARMGDIVQTVTGSGQVSSENQLDVTSKASGEVQSVNVTVGQHVAKGQLLATIDPHDALASLQSAQIAYAKLTAPAKGGDLANAENSVTKSYGDAFNSAADAFVDLASVMAGLRDLLYGQGGFLSEAYSVRLNSTARPMRASAGQRYDVAAARYAEVLQEYQTLTRNSPTAEIDSLVSNTYALLTSVSAAVQEAQAAANYIVVNQPDYYTGSAASTVTNLNSWAATVNSDLASVLSAQSSITSSANSLNELVTGADSLDVQSQRLSLQQAEEAYAEYFVRAPFDGIVGRIPVSVYAQAGASTVIATIIGDQKIATISLNEVDAAKVAAGQPVSITFDAIDDFVATGTVSQVDLVGTASSGVVSYGVRISINTSDPRIKPGMSLNTTITTKEKRNVLVVPSAAVKSLGSARYVQTLSPETARIEMPQMRDQAMRSASGTDAIGTSTTRQSSGSGTRAFGTISMQTTVSTDEEPQRVTVTVGDADDTNIEILSGIEAGDLVIIRTTASGSSGSSASAATPSLFSGVRGGTGAGAIRTAAPAGR